MVPNSWLGAYADSENNNNTHHISRFNIKEILYNPKVEKKIINKICLISVLLLSHNVYSMEK